MTGTGDEWTIATAGEERLERRARLAHVMAYVHAVQAHVEARLAGGEVAAVAWPEALRHELERIRRATE